MFRSLTPGLGPYVLNPVVDCFLIVRRVTTSYMDGHLTITEDLEKKCFEDNCYLLRSLLRC
jgi:hypothetical protein